MDLYFIFRKEQKRSCVSDFLATLGKYELTSEKDYQIWLGKQKEKGCLEYVFTDFPEKGKTVQDAVRALVREGKNA